MVLFNIASYVISGILAKIFSSPVASYAYENFFGEMVLAKLRELMPTGSVEGEITTVITSAIESLPEYIQVLISHFFSAEVISSGTPGEAMTVEMIEQTYLAPVVTNVLAIVAMVLLFLLLVFILRIVFAGINKGLTKKKHKFIRGTNTLFGAAFGAVKGTLIISLIAAVLNIGAPVINNATLNDFVNGSAICNMVAEILK